MSFNFGSVSYSADESPVGTVIKFNPLTGTDTIFRGRVNTSVAVKFQCLSIMKEYENKSLEEWRLEDYVAGRKGRSCTTSSSENVFASVRAEQSKFGTPANSNITKNFTATTNNSTAPASGFTFGTSTKDHSAVTPNPFSFTATTTGFPFGAATTKHSTVPSISFAANPCTFPPRTPLVNSSATSSTTFSFGGPKSKTKVASCFDQTSQKKSPVSVVGEADTDWASKPSKYTWTIKELAERSGFYRVASPTFLSGLNEFRMLLYLGGDLPEDTTLDMPDNKNPSSVFGSTSNDRSVEAFPADIILAIEMVRTCQLIRNLEEHWKLSVKLIDQTLLKSFRFSMNYKLGWKIRYFVLPYELARQILTDNKRSVICELSLEPGAEPIAEAATQAETSGMEELSRDLVQLLLSAEASDATVRVKGREFPVHRNILAARTPVFSSMFRLQMSERETGLVDIEDCEPDTFDRFLQYVYGGKVEDLNPQNASALYEVAEKYQVEGLKSDCLACIRDGLSVRSLCDAVALATRHGETELTSLASDFFALNIKDVIVTIEWQTFLAENPTQANELLIKAHLPDQK